MTATRSARTTTASTMPGGTSSARGAAPASFADVKRHEREALERSDMTRRAREEAKREHDQATRIAELKGLASERWAEVKKSWGEVVVCLVLVVVTGGAAVGTLLIGAGGVAKWLCVVAVLTCIVACVGAWETGRLTARFWASRAELYRLAPGPVDHRSPPRSADGTGVQTGAGAGPPKPGS